MIQKHICPICGEPFTLCEDFTAEVLKSGYVVFRHSFKGPCLMPYREYRKLRKYMKEIIMVPWDIETYYKKLPWVQRKIDTEKLDKIANTAVKKYIRKRVEEIVENFKKQGFYKKKDLGVTVRGDIHDKLKEICRKIRNQYGLIIFPADIIYLAVKEYLNNKKLKR